MCQIREKNVPTTTATAATTTANTITVAPTPDDMTTSPGLCPKSKDKWSWVPFDGNCYKLIGDEFQWDEAWRYCREEGDLVSIHSEEENNFLGKLIEEQGITSIHIGAFVNSYDDIVNDK